MFRRAHRSLTLTLGLAATLAAGVAAAQGTPPMPMDGTKGVPMGEREPAMNMEKKSVAELRYPQPVLVGDLAERLVLDATSRQRALGRIDAVQRNAAGEVEIVVRYGGILGFGSRKIAVPAHATTLLGPYLQIVDLDPSALDALPTWSGNGATAVPPEEQVRIGVNRN